jgi:hypothetical protein
VYSDTKYPTKITIGNRNINKLGRNLCAHEGKPGIVRPDNLKNANPAEGSKSIPIAVNEAAIINKEAEFALEVELSKKAIIPTNTKTSAKIHRLTMARALNVNCKTEYQFILSW